MKKISKIVFILIGITIIIIYCFPIRVGLVNIGVVAGLGVGLLFILAGIFLEKILKLKKSIISIVCIIAVIGFSAFGVTLSNIISSTTNEPKGDETLLVLGCQVIGETASSPLRNRTIAGVKYLKEHPSTNVILCGGKGNGERITEAECMRRIMVDNGIDESRIFIEDKSTSTDENIEFAKEYLTSDNVVISTSDYHCYRAELIARKNGLNACSIPVGTSKYAGPGFYTREVFAVWVQYLKMI